MDLSIAIWILILPFVAFVFTGILNGKLEKKISGLISILSIGGATLLSYYIAFQFFSGSREAVQIELGTWIKFTDSLVVNFGLLLDPISVMMLVVITTVSLMVHIYSTGYMRDEGGYARYFSFLSLFSFSMLGLVLSTNLIQLYIFWELVGASSFLLIGFYYRKPSAIAAAKKAFIVTRFADFGFLVGILLFSFHTGTFNILEVNASSGPAISQDWGGSFLGFSVLSWSLILMFIGGAGKSAMFPFHVWLPDAMEGPTPVSALIHAATMVVAGVYLVARLFPVFALGAPDALEIVAYVGGFTSLLAAILAIVQTDIKKVLAYSTISQIGYMMLALGVSGYGEAGLGFTASMFHLFTHAFFKALLFLGAGSIIHAVHSNEMNDMGGLRKKMPATHITFLIATLAISGIPPFSGFFSKDEILVAAYQSNVLLFGIEYLVAGLTAFYMFRLYFKVFWNKTSTSEVHESPASMTIPMWLLAIGAVFAGFVPFTDWITTDGVPLETHFHWNIAIASVGIALAGIGFAYRLYKSENSRSRNIANVFGSFYQLVIHKFYIDEFYLFVTKGIIFRFVSAPIAWFDKHIVDGFLDLTGNSIVAASVKTKNIQSGEIHQYAYFILMGVLITTMLILYISHGI